MKPPPMPPKRTAPPSLGKKETRTVKKFSTAPWTGAGEGEKIVLYGSSGVGKTTLASMLPNPIFIGLDDGGRKIRNPKTGEPVVRVEGVQAFADIRDALHQIDLFPRGSTVVIDTLTVLENLAEPWMFDNIKHEKGGTVTSLEGYGYGKGYTHLFETMRLIVQDLDALVRRGVNVCLICQNMAVKRANPGGLDFLEDGPKLSHPFSEKTSVRLHICEWTDHCLRIGYHGTVVIGAPDAKVGKASGDVQRAVFVTPEPHFFAKSRTLSEPVVAFETQDDDSIWTMIFEENK